MSTSANDRQYHLLFEYFRRLEIGENTGYNWKKQWSLQKHFKKKIDKITYAV